MKAKHSILLVSLLLAGCEHNAALNQTQTTSAPKVTPLALVLVPPAGDTRLDAQIRQMQEQVRAGKSPEAALERLGWLFVAKARTTFDPGFYKLAEQCALCLESKTPHAPEALLLHGHILQNLHRFKEAEPLARELVTRRGLPFDFGLLGDVLMEQGRLNEAVEAYQRMADLRPDLQACARAGHVRWLKGDLDGAIEMMRSATQAATPLDAESAAWVYSRMAVYQMQAGDLRHARQNCNAALEFQSNYPPALLMEGRLALAERRNTDACEFIRQAVALNPLPEYQWAFIEALQTAGRIDEAASIKRDLKARGAAADPRTFALYLATVGEDAAEALRLARTELQTRRDVLTFDALAWSLAACAQWEEAQAQSRRALAEGTRDPRLLLHAGIIAAQLRQADEARSLFAQAETMRQMLLPSERALLAKYSRPTLSLPEAMRFQTSQNQ